MSVVIPLSSDTDHFSFTVELDGTTYGFEWLWSYRDSAWYFSIDDANGNRLLSHRKAVVSFPLLSRFQIAALPKGTLMLQDTSRQLADPGLTDLGNRVLLVYFSPGEM